MDPPEDQPKALASMKALHKRKGNLGGVPLVLTKSPRLNESPSQKEGKYARFMRRTYPCHRLNESPSKKEGKCLSLNGAKHMIFPPQ